jgi:hypothetical protein
VCSTSVRLPHNATLTRCFSAGSFGQFLSRCVSCLDAANSTQKRLPTVQFDSGRSCITLFNSIAAHYCHLWQWRGGNDWVMNYLADSNELSSESRYAKPSPLLGHRPRGGRRGGFGLRHARGVVPGTHFGRRRGCGHQLIHVPDQRIPFVVRARGR